MDDNNQKLLKVNKTPMMKLLKFKCKMSVTHIIICYLLFYHPEDGVSSGLTHQGVCLCFSMLLKCY